MKCPWCEREMTDGFINSARKVVFSKKPQDADAFFFWPDAECINLTQYNWTRPSAKAYHCENCQKVIVDYSIEIE